jgi:hypothetical protein
VASPVVRWAFLRTKGTSVSIALVLALLPVAVLVTFFAWLHSGGIAVSAAGMTAAAELFVVALWDFLRMYLPRLPSVSWMPKHRLPDAFGAFRSSLVPVSFFVGILVGHFVWR